MPTRRFGVGKLLQPLQAVLQRLAQWCRYAIRINVVCCAVLLSVYLLVLSLCRLSDLQPKYLEAIHIHPNSTKCATQQHHHESVACFSLVLWGSGSCNRKHGSCEVDA